MQAGPADPTPLAGRLGQGRPRHAVVLPDAGTLVVVTVLAVLVMVLASPQAHADTTTGPSTTGTASTVSPSTVAVGGTVMYTVSGFPRRATVEVLIDDGALVDPVGSEAAVVSTVTMDERGTASGSFELPDYVGQGSHWLRFRASAGPDVATSEIRTIDYTNKSPYFTVAGVTVIGAAEGTSAASSGASAATAPSEASAGPSATGDIVIDPGSRTEAAGEAAKGPPPVARAVLVSAGVALLALVAAMVVRLRQLFRR